MTSDEKDYTYRLRWTTSADITVTVTVAADELDDEDPISVEEYAYDVAVARAKERLEQVAVQIGGVAVHADIDGMEADEIEMTSSPAGGAS